MNFKLKILPLVATKLTSGAFQEMKHQTGMTEWPSGNILDLTFVPDCRRSGVRIPVEKMKFVCVYLPSLSYKCFVAVY